MPDSKPNYKTITNFRSDNAKVLRKANANKSSIYVENNLKKQLTKIENKIQEYQDRINSQDKQEDKSNYPSSTDDKHNLIVEEKLTQFCHDSKMLYEMLSETKRF